MSHAQAANRGHDQQGVLPELTPAARADETALSAQPFPGRGDSPLDRRIVAFYLVFHVALIGVFVVPLSTPDVLIFVASYALRMFGISAGYHRYFSHRSFKTGRGFQLVLALLAMASWQRGVLWWASTHRWHHSQSDRPGDEHSPAQYGLWRAHAGWLLYRRNSRLKADLVRDLLRFPELAFLDRHYHVVPMAWAFGTLLVGGLPGLYWGFVVSTLLLFHVMGLGNSLAHWRGPRRYNTPDNSRNSVLYSLGTLGEFHNNHHHDPSSANQRRAWWELDLIHLALKLLSKTGLVWDLRLRHGTRRGELRA